MLVLTLGPKTGMQIALGSGTVVSTHKEPSNTVVLIKRATILGAFGLVLAQVKERTNGQLGSSFCYLQL